MNFLKIVSEGKLKGKIREIEKIEGGTFAGLSVTFKDDFQNETWMSENLLKIEKPELVKKAEKYLRRITQSYRNNNSEEEDSSDIQHTSLTEWMAKGDSDA